MSKYIYIMSINMIYIYIYVYIFFIFFIIINPFTVTSKGDIHKHNGAFGTAPEALTGSWWHQLLRVESSMNQRDNDATYNPFFALWNCMTSLSWRRTSWTCMASLRRCLQAGKIVLWRTHEFQYDDWAKHCCIILSSWPVEVVVEMVPAAQVEVGP